MITLFGTAHDKMTEPKKVYSHWRTYICGFQSKFFSVTELLSTLHAQVVI